MTQMNLTINPFLRAWIERRAKRRGHSAQIELDHILINSYKNSQEGVLPRTEELRSFRQAERVKQMEGLESMESQEEGARIGAALSGKAL